MDIPINNIGLMTIADKLVHQQYPSAVQIEDHGIPVNGSAINATDPMRWQYIFNDPATTPNSTVIITSDERNEFAKPQHVDSPWLGDIDKNLPRNMSLAQSLTLLRHAGYSLPFSYVSLRQPLYPGVVEAEYIFTLGSAYVAVGTQSGQVHVVGHKPGSPGVTTVAPPVVQPSRGSEIEYKAFLRKFQSGQAGVLELMATCYYPVGGYQLFFESSGDAKFTLLERSWPIHNQLVTYYLASWTSGQPLASPPGTVLIIDGRGEHPVKAHPWA